MIRRIETQIGSTQKNFFCPDNNCLDQRTDTSIRYGSSQVKHSNASAIGLDAGLTEGFSSVKYQVFNKANPSEITQLDINFVVEGNREKGHIYSSSLITIHDLYPNPVVTSANRLRHPPGACEGQDHHPQHFRKPAVGFTTSFPVRTVLRSRPSDSTPASFYTLYVNNESVPHTEADGEK